MKDEEDVVAPPAVDAFVPPTPVPVPVPLVALPVPLAALPVPLALPRLLSLSAGVGQRLQRDVVQSMINKVCITRGVSQGVYWGGM